MLFHLVSFFTGKGKLLRHFIIVFNLRHVLMETCSYANGRLHGAKVSAVTIFCASIMSSALLSFVMQQHLFQQFCVLLFLALIISFALINLLKLYRKRCV